MFDTFKLNLGSFCHFDIERLGRPIASMRSAAMFPRLCPQSPGRLSLIVGWCTVETTISTVTSDSSLHRGRPRGPAGSWGFKPVAGYVLNVPRSRVTLLASTF